MQASTATAVVTANFPIPDILPYQMAKSQEEIDALNDLHAYHAALMKTNTAYRTYIARWTSGNEQLQKALDDTEESARSLQHTLKKLQRQPFDLREFLIVMGVIVTFFAISSLAVLGIAYASTRYIPGLNRFHWIWKR